MSDIIGRLVSIGYQKEAVRGTAIITSLNWIGKLELDFMDKGNVIQNESSFGHIAKANRQDMIRRWSEGGFTAKLFDKAIGDILVMAFGQSPTTANVSGDTSVKDHTFALLNSNMHASYTLAVVEGDVDQQVFPGTIMDQLVIDAVADDYAKVQVGLKGRKGAVPGSTLTPAFTEENEFVPKHIKAYVAATGSDMDAATVTASVREVHLTIAKNLVDRDTINSDDIDPRNTTIEVTGELSLYYDATTFQNYWKNQTKLALRLEFANNDVTIGTSSHPNVKIDIPLIQISDFTKDYGNDDLVMQTVSFTGLLKLSTGALITAKVRNLTTSY